MTKRITYTYEGPKMDLLEKSRWITALLDGSRKQGKDALKWADGKMCCLGVKCEVDGDSFPPSPDNYDGILLSEGGYSYMYDKGLPEGKLVTYYGPDADEGQLTVAAALSIMNDRGWSFKKIAHWIDANL